MNNGATVLKYIYYFYNFKKVLFTKIQMGLEREQSMEDAWV